MFLLKTCSFYLALRAVPSVLWSEPLSEKKCHGSLKLFSLFILPLSTYMIFFPFSSCLPTWTLSPYLSLKNICSMNIEDALIALSPEFFGVEQKAF